MLGLAFCVRSSTALLKVAIPPMAVPIRMPHFARSSPSKLPGSRLNPALRNACPDRDNTVIHFRFLNKNESFLLGQI